MDSGSIFRRIGEEQHQLTQVIGGISMDRAMNEQQVRTIHFEPPRAERRQNSVCPGVTVESVVMLSGEPFESRYCGPLHLLIAHERLARRRGMTTIEGLPPSDLQNLSRTFTFVPAGRQFSEWHDSDMPSMALYIHIDPFATLMTTEERAAGGGLPPRLHFQSLGLWQTVLKVKALAEDGRSICGRYADALGTVLAHELLHSNAETAVASAALRGGLAVWQRRLVAQYVEDHLAESVPVAALAELARLSRYHFCRSFRRSFGISPHRYHSTRKIERAKMLLADRDTSVTAVALEVGFQETSAFTTVFRKLVGCTPSDYRRSLSPKGA
jgi:AraC family transcriptional regulator